MYPLINNLKSLLERGRARRGEQQYRFLLERLKRRSVDDFQ